jgi:Mn-dependent DtxR family transcriptional regulator
MSECEDADSEQVSAEWLISAEAAEQTQIVEDLIARGLVEIVDDELRLTEAGRTLAARCERKLN